MSIMYGPGGYLPDHPNNNVVEVVDDHGDGTGTRTTYNPDGSVAEVVEVSDLPIPTPDPSAAVAAALAAVSGLPSDDPARLAAEALAAVMAPNT